MARHGLRRLVCALAGCGIALACGLGGCGSGTRGAYLLSRSVTVPPTGSTADRPVDLFAEYDEAR